MFRPRLGLIWFHVLFILMAAGPVFADAFPQKPRAQVIDCGIRNLTNAYGLTGTSLFTDLVGKQHIEAINTSSKTIALSVNTTGCSSPTPTDDILIPAGLSSSKDFINIGPAICARSVGATISSGSLFVTVW